MKRTLSGLALVATLCLLLAACSSRQTKEKFPEPPAGGNTEAQAHKLYGSAHDQLVRRNYVQANKEFDTLMSHYPFSRYATQAQLEQIYAKYQSNDPEEALSDANRFLQEHPRYPSADYVLYLEGLINMRRSESLTRYLHVNQTYFDPSHLEAAFDDFALLQRRFPDSRYAADARQRMIWLRNRIAQHELNTARFYFGRGAWVAAARRAQGIIANYPGAPATASALVIMQQSYAALGLKEQATQIQALIAENRPALKAAGVTPQSRE
ncbi:MAG TPA: outer membrane protein assembly factor BamD [Nevskiaceae bacterium]